MKHSVGWACPPKDYRKWHDLVFELVRHCAERYGHDEIVSWYWELWNEPDIFYWRGTPEQPVSVEDRLSHALVHGITDFIVQDTEECWQAIRADGGITNGKIAAIGTLILGFSLAVLLLESLLRRQRTAGPAPDPQ